MAPLHLLEDGDRAKPRRRPQHRHDLALEERGEGIRAAAVPHLLLVRGQPAILRDAISRGRADRCLRRRHRRRVCLPELHVKPHLVIGDMAAGQWADPFDEKIHPHTRSVAIARRSVPPDGASDRAFRGLRLRSGSALPSAQTPEISLILIVRRSHLSCPPPLFPRSAARPAPPPPAPAAAGADGRRGAMPDSALWQSSMAAGSNSIDSL